MASKTNPETKTKKPIVKYCGPDEYAKNCQPATQKQIDDSKICGSGTTAVPGTDEGKDTNDGTGKPATDKDGTGKPATDKDGTGKPATDKDGTGKGEDPKPLVDDAAAKKLKDKLKAIYDFHKGMKVPSEGDAAAKLNTVLGYWKANAALKDAGVNEEFEHYFNGDDADWDAGEIPVTDNFKKEFVSINKVVGSQNLKEFYNKKNPPKGGRRRRRGGTKRRRKSKRRKSKRRKSKRRKSKRRKSRKKRSKRRRTKRRR